MSSEAAQRQPRMPGDNPRHADAQSLAELRDSVGRFPDDAGLRSALGDALWAAGREEEAIGAYLVAHRLDPSDSSACVKMGRFFLSRDMCDPALLWLRKAIELDSNDSTAIASSAVAEVRRGNRDHAARLLEAWVDAVPESPMRPHLAAAILGEETPDTAPPGYVRGLFDNYAPRFDDGLRKLEYRGPELIEGAIQACDDAPWTDEAALDLGCGTGLVGQAIRGHVGRLVGVDLSPRMLEVAGERRLYDELHEREMADFMRERPADFALLTASDVLTYVGELATVAAAARIALRPGGWFFAVLEEAPDGSSTLGYLLQESGRFAHEAGYAIGCFGDAGFDARVVSRRPMRSENGSPTPSFTFAARCRGGGGDEPDK